MSTMHINLKVGESLQVGEARLTFAELQSGRRVRLTVEAPREVPIARQGLQSPITSAQECASSPKEHTHGEHPV